jgi:hypothetical protein
MLSVKKKFLSDDTAFNNTISKAGEELNFFSEASEILRQFFAALIFCFFSIKRKES